MIKVRKYTVEFELRTENDDPDKLFKAYIDELSGICDSLERIKVVSIQPKTHGRVSDEA